MKLEEQYKYELNRLLIPEDGYSLNESIEIIQENSTWLYDDSCQKFTFRFNENQTLIAGGGHVAIVSSELFNEEKINEGDGVLSSILSPMGNYISAIGYVGAAWSHIADGGKILDNKTFIGLAGLGELAAFIVAVVAVFYSAGVAAKGADVAASTTFNVVLGVLFFIGGVWECMNAGVLVNNLGKFQEELDNEEKYKEFQYGAMHSIMGAITVLMAVTPFGHKVVHKITDVLKKVFAKLFTTLSKLFRGMSLKLLRGGIKSSAKAGTEVAEDRIIQAIESGALNKLYHIKIKQTNTAHHYAASFFAFFIGGFIGKGASTGASVLTTVLKKGMNLLIGIFETVEEKTSAYSTAIKDKTNAILKSVSEWDTWLWSGLKDTLVAVVTIAVKIVAKLVTWILDVVSKVAGAIKTILQLIYDYNFIIEEKKIVRTNAVDEIYSVVEPDNKESKANLQVYYNNDGKEIERNIKAKSNAEDIKKDINQRLNISDTLDTSSKDKIGADGFVKMGASSTAVTVNYKGEDKKLQKLGNIVFDSSKGRKSEEMKDVLIVKNVQKGKYFGKEFGVIRNKDGSYRWHKQKTNENFLSFEDFSKQNINENVMNTKKESYFKLFEEYVEMEKKKEEVNESFISSTIEFSEKAINTISLYFRGMFGNGYTKLSGMNKKELLAFIEDLVDSLEGKLTTNEYNSVCTMLSDFIAPKVKSGEIKKFSEAYDLIAVAVGMKTFKML